MAQLSLRKGDDLSLHLQSNNADIPFTWQYEQDDNALYIRIAPLSPLSPLTPVVLKWWRKHPQAPSPAVMATYEYSFDELTTSWRVKVPWTFPESRRHAKCPTAS